MPLIDFIRDLMICEPTAVGGVILGFCLISFHMCLYFLVQRDVRSEKE